MGQESRRRGFWISAVLVVALGVAVFNVFPFRQLIAQNRAVEETRIELETLQEENQRLERNIETLKSPAEIERIARVDYGYVRPGDTSYVLVETPVRQAPTEEAPEPEEEEQSRGFWNAIWDFITGRDLTDE